MWLSLIPLGLGSWAPVYGGVVAHKRAWWLAGAIWSVITVAGWTLAGVSNPNGGLGDVGGLLIILGWVGGFASSAVIHAVSRRSGEPAFNEAVVDAKERLRQREQARGLARNNPRIAIEMGVGRPDLPGAQDAGLVDVNNVPPSILASLRGVDDALASKIVDARTRMEGFSSVEDLGAAVDLDGDLVERLRDRVVFLPRD